MKELHEDVVKAPLINKVEEYSKEDNLEFNVLDNSLDCIFNDSLLGFENGWSNEVGKLEAQDPFEEVNLAEEGEKSKSTYVITLLDENLKK